MNAVPSEHADLGERHDRPELGRVRVRVQREQAERRQADDERGDELERDVEKEVALPQAACMRARRGTASAPIVPNCLVVRARVRVLGGPALPSKPFGLARSGATPRFRNGKMLAVVERRRHARSTARACRRAILADLERVLRVLPLAARALEALDPCRASARASSVFGCEVGVAARPVGRVLAVLVRPRRSGPR